jgi:ATP-dependent exoDNAse (exonuclease V) alpha subunit
MSLTKHQKEIFDSIISDISAGINGDSDYSVVSLVGSAGTGKTYLLSKVIQYFSDMGYSVCVTAPTHKAVRVVRQTLESNIGNIDKIDTRTIHSFLKLKLEPNLNTGLPMLKPDPYAKEKGNRVDILCCDESSMISDELLSYSADKLNDGTVKVLLLVGDIFQLKPVDDDQTSDFIQNEHEYKLTEIVRQAKDNPIIKTSVVLKKIIEMKKYPAISDLLFKNHTVVKSRKDFFDLYFSDKTDKMIGTFTNRTVNMYNQYIRNQLINSDDYVVTGEEFVFYDTLFENDKIVHLNSDVSTVKRCQKKYDYKYNVEYWFIVDEDDIMYKILDKDYIEKYNDMLESIANQAKAADGSMRRKYWKGYYTLKSRFANVRYNYASTLHRLQGSTVNNIYLDFSDLHNEFYDKDTIFRLMYVGITRARENAIILI